jgi:thiol-disulfide isomerase/thioredoxin
MLRNKDFFIGLGAGVALAMVALDMWGSYLERRIVSLGQPRLVQPFRQRRALLTPESSEGLPRPWLPAATPPPHDGWSIRALGGKPVTLGDFKGKVVFLNLWSTTCAPCVAEMPSIERLRESLKNEPVVFFAVTQEDEQTVRSFVQKVPLGVPVYLADEDAPEDLDAIGFPTTYILDRKGRTIYREMGGVNWDYEDARTFIRNLATE